MSKPRKGRFFTAKRIQGALPVVSAGLGFLSTLPLGAAASRALSAVSLAAAAAPSAASGETTERRIKADLRAVLERLEQAADLPPAEVQNLYIRVLTLARLLVEDP